VFAVLLIVNYVRNLENQYTQDYQLTPAFVAAAEIPRGTPGEQAINDKSIIKRDIPQQFVPSTAIKSTDAVQKKVAVFRVAPGSVIVDGMFVDPATTTISFRERLKNKNHVAISIQVDQVKGVGGFLVPGDEVNMMVYQDNEATKQALEAAETGEGPRILPEFNITPLPPENYVRTGGPQWLVINKTARVMFQKVQVLAVGQNQLLGPGEQSSTATGDDQQTTTQNNTGLITFNVPPEASQWIATGQDAGFYLALVAKDYVPRDLPPLPVVVDRLPGEDPGILTPYEYTDPEGNKG
jgi:Flp pilus assembly protein CpaB